MVQLPIMLVTSDADFELAILHDFKSIDRHCLWLADHDDLPIESNMIGCSLGERDWMPTAQSMMLRLMRYRTKSAGPRLGMRMPAYTSLACVGPNRGLSIKTDRNQDRKCAGRGRKRSDEKPIGMRTAVRMMTSLCKSVSGRLSGVRWLHSPETLVRDFLAFKVGLRIVSRQPVHVCDQHCAEQACASIERPSRRRSHLCERLLIRILGGRLDGSAPDNVCLPPTLQLPDGRLLTVLRHAVCDRLEKGFVGGIAPGGGVNVMMHYIHIAHLHRRHRRAGQLCARHNIATCRSTGWMVHVNTIANESLAGSTSMAHANGAERKQTCDG